MTLTRRLIIAFWAFIVIMGIWEFYTYNQGVNQATLDHPQQAHFYFFHTNGPPVAPSQVHANGADVEQTAFVVQDNTPSRGNFTCLVTLKNLGNAKATGIQVNVRPYRGVSKSDDDVGRSDTTVLSDNDPTSQFGQYIPFPDLAPGESSTQSVSFLSRDDYKPGKNPNPDIIFETEKPPPLPLRKPVE
jgi:hypothetical protein